MERRRITRRKIIRGIVKTQQATPSKVRSVLKHFKTSELRQMRSQLRKDARRISKEIKHRK